MSSIYKNKLVYYETPLHTITSLSKLPAIVQSCFMYTNSQKTVKGQRVNVLGFSHNKNKNNNIWYVKNR